MFNSKNLLALYFFQSFCLVLSFGTCASVSSLCLTLCFYILNETATSPSFEGEPKSSISPQLYVSLEPLCLSKQPVLFLIAPGCRGCAQLCQCPEGEDLSQNPPWVQAGGKPGPGNRPSVERGAVMSAAVCVVPGGVACSP